MRVTIDKQVPVAGGMGGGSADAAAVLRMARLVALVGADAVAELAASLGADVPSQLEPGLALGTGAGDVVKRLAQLAVHAYVIVPLPHFLSAAEVYREADRLGLPRSASEFGALSAELSEAVVPGAVLPGGLVVNDLAPAAISLCPAIAEALEAVRSAGADVAFVSGSGPTVAGLFWGPDGRRRAGAVASELARRYPGAMLGGARRGGVRGPGAYVTGTWPITAVRHNSTTSVSNQSITYLVAAGLGVLGVLTYSAARRRPRGLGLPARVRASRRLRAVGVRPGRARGGRRVGRRRGRGRVAQGVLNRTGTRPLG